MKNELVITAAERDSPLWRKMVTHLLVCLDDYRALNDSTLTEKDTTFLRGRIYELKRLLRYDAAESPAAQAPGEL